MFDIFVSHVVKGTSPEDIKSHLEEKSIQVHEIEKTSKDESRFDSFRVKIDRGHYDTTCGSGAETCWPLNVSCRPFYRPKVRAGAFNEKAKENPS